MLVNFVPFCLALAMIVLGAFLTLGSHDECAKAVRIQKVAYEAARQDVLDIKQLIAKPPEPAWHNVGDFWNDPRRWDGIDAGKGETFWSKRRPDVIEV